MKKKKWILVIILVILLVAGIMIFPNILPIIQMRPTETGKISDTNIISVNTGINSMFFIESDGKYTVIDAGMNANSTMNTLNDLGIDPLDVKYLLMTHSDGDHVSALPLFKNADIYMNEDEFQMLDGTTKRNNTSENSLPEGVLLENIIPLENNQKLILDGKEIECIKTSGHTPGSMIYLLDGTYMFTGDALRVNNNSMEVHPFTMDNDMAKDSINLISELKKDCELILTAHYGVHNSEDISVKKP